MADHYTADEIRQIFEEYATTIKNGKKVTEDLTKRFKDAEKGVVNYTNNLNASLQQLSRSGLGIARSLKDGKRGSSIYNDAISGAADVISNIASQFGPVGAIFGAIVKAGSEAVKAINQQADALKDSYQEMSRVGVTGAAGMSGVFSNMQKLGYGIKELGQMSDLLRDNADVLATLGGTAASGADQFANLAGSIQRSGDQIKLREMGIGIDDINKGAAAYMRQQSSIGRGRNMTGDQLRDSTVEYLKQTDLMRKLTGKGQEQQEEELKKSYAQEAFNQTMFELEEAAAKGDTDAASQVKKLKEIMLSNLPNDMKDQLRRAIGGDFGAADKLAMVAPDAVRMAMDKKASVGQTMNAFRDGIKENQQLRASSQAKLNTYNEDFGDLADQRKFLASMGNDNYDDIKDRAQAQQDVIDPLAKAAVTNETMQLRARDSMQSMLQKGIVPVTNAIAGLSGLIEKGTGAVAKAVGAAPAGGAPPLGGKPGAPAKAAPAPVAPAGAKVSGMEGIKAMVAQHEGIRTRPYKDTKGLWTIGVGHLIGNGRDLPPEYNREFSMKEVMDLFEVDFAKHVSIAERTPGWDKANESGKGAMIDLAFNMGQWWPKWPTTSKALQAGDFKAAAAGLQDSAWYKQVGGRGATIVGMMAAGGKDKGYAQGGVPTGPQSGYQTTLHGTEAVIPMKENKIPVQAKMMAEGLASRSALFEQNMTKIGDLVRIMSKQVDVSQKIFSSAR
jgi:lysozyme